VLPAFPPLALVLGRYLVKAPGKRLALWSALAIPVGLALLVMAWRVADGAKDDWSRAMFVAAQPWAIAAALVFLAGTIATTLLALRGRRWPAMVIAALATMLVIDMGEDAYEELTPRQSCLQVAEYVKQYAGPKTQLYFVGHYEQTVPFYLGRTVPLFDYQDEFEVGQNAEARFALRGTEEFAYEWSRQADALAIMQPRVYEKLRDLGLPMTVLHADPKRILVRKP
jgi:hypothetical protein